jgi:vitamin B12 transporter
MTCTSPYARVRVFTATVLASILLISETSIRAQPASVTVAGAVKDASGAVIVGADVETVVAGRILAATSSGGDGQYRIAVPRGTPFELRVRRDGFADYAADLTGTTEDARKDVTLQVGGVSDTLIVTASGATENRASVTSAVTVVTADDIHAMGASQLSDVLRFVPGFAIEGNGREGAVISAFSRGGESDYNLVLIDGVRVNTQGGFFDFSRVGGGEIDRVEVVRGAQSALWGSDAMGSVVQVFTKRAGTDDAPQVSGSVEGGTFNTWRGDARVTGGAHRRFDYHVGATYRKTDGAFADILPQEDWFEQTAFDGGLGVTLGRRAAVRTSVRSSNTQGRSVSNITFGARDTQGTYDTKNLSWNTDVSHTVGARFAGTGTVNYFRYTQITVDTFADPPFTTYTVLEGTPNALFPNGVRLVRLIDQAEFSSLVAAGAAPGPGQFLASATSFDFATSRTESCPEPAQCPTVFHRPAVRYQGDYAWAGGQRLSAGYAWEREMFDSLVSAPLSTGFGLDNNAVFVQQQSSFADRWFMTVGVRVDGKESYDTFVSPKLSVGGFVVPLRQAGLSSLKIFGNIGKGIKSPNFSERFGASFADPNPDLRVEEARTGDIGVEATFASQRFRGAVSYFNNDYKDQIAFRSGVVGDDLPEFINIDRSDADGWELEAALQRPVHGFIAGGSYSYVDTRVVTAIGTSQQFQPGQPLLRRPRHSGYIRAAYRLGKATANFDVRVAGDRHDNSFLSLRTVPNAAFPNAFTTDITVNPGYAVAGLGLDVRIDRDLTVYIRGNNITDTEYDSVLGYPGMPRTVMVGAQFRIGRLQ